MSDVIQKDISTFVPSNFPQFYLEKGPVFVAFVQAYFKWLESRTEAVTKVLKNQTVAVATGNNTVTGTRTSFDAVFSPGDKIGIYTSRDDYSIYTVDSVANSSVLTLTSDKVPNFTNSATSAGLVSLLSNPVYDNRRILEYIDVDETPDDLLSHFKSKFLAGIQFDTEANIRLLLKHTLDLYRAKGTEQALQLLFRIVYGTSISVYYPGSDLFRLSDGEWHVPEYVEIGLYNDASNLVGRTIVGLNSGARAFVDRAVRRTVSGRLVDVLYISSRSGDFLHSEYLDFTTLPTLDPSNRPRVQGSLTQVLLDQEGSGEDFSVGDLVNVSSETGGEAVARVTSVVNNPGVIRFSLDNGGFGYEVGGNTTVTVSDWVLAFSNVRFNPIVRKHYFDFGDTFTQEIGAIQYTSGVGTFPVGADVTAYDGSSVVLGTGRVLTSSPASSNTGQIVVAVANGALSSGTIKTVGNTVTASVSVANGYTDESATFAFVGMVNAATVTVNTPAFTISPNTSLCQLDEVGSKTATGTITRVSTIGPATTLTLSNTDGIWVSARHVFNANVDLGVPRDVTIAVGVKAVNGTPSTLANNYVRADEGDFTGSVTFRSSGSGANITLNNSLFFATSLAIGNVFLNPIGSIELGADAYTFTHVPTANAGSYLSDADVLHDITVGRLTGIASQVVGAGYSIPPIVVVRDEQVIKQAMHDFILTVDTVGYQEGEVVVLGSSRGYVASVEGVGNVLRVNRLSPDSSFTISIAGTVFLSNYGSVELGADAYGFDADPTANTSGFLAIADIRNADATLTGQSSGVAGNVLAVAFVDEPLVGADAVISSSLSMSNGTLVEVEVLESGYGFETGQDVVITAEDGRVAFGFANCVTQGSGHGFFRQKGGFLSDQKVIHDGYYWQDFSYDIFSSVPLDKYEGMLKQVTHVAGTKNFATLVTELAAGNTSSISTTITIS